MNETTPTRSDSEIIERFAMAGIILPAERADAAIAGARRYLNMQHWLRGPRSAADEPSNIFTPLARGEAA